MLTVTFFTELIQVFLFQINVKQHMVLSSQDIWNAIFEDNLKDVDLGVNCVVSTMMQ